MSRAMSIAAAVGALALCAPAARAEAPKPCGKANPVQGALCGSVTVPLDRSLPGGPTTVVGYELYPGEAATPTGTTLALQGGPGLSTTATRDQFLDVFGGLAARRNLLLVDTRGTGTSGAVDCPALQHAIADLGQSSAAAVAACARQLGDAASHYGSDEIAEDLDAVRAAVGVAAVDLYAPSAASIPALAYLARHPDRVRSLVLDSPALPGDDTFHGAQARAEADAVALVCRRSPSCGPRHRRAGGELAALARFLQRHPVRGLAAAPDGRRRAMRVDESVLALLASDTSSGYLNQGELLAAGTAARHGDPAALLRLAAEVTAPLPPDDPAVFSAGAQAATSCRDGEFAWQRSATPADRRAQYRAAVQALAADAFAPFSVAGWLGSHQGVGVGGPFCLDWAGGPDAPTVPASGALPQVPALVLTSDIDVGAVDRVADLAGRIAGARLVVVRDAAHVTAPRNRCVTELVDGFVETLTLVDASCAARSTPHYAVGDFAARASALPPARPAPGARAGSALRRVASAAWLGVYDSIQHSYRLSQPHGLGLRGGAYESTFGRGTQRVTLAGTRFTRDVAVTGEAVIDFETGVVRGDVAVRVRGRRVGRLHLAGRLFPHDARVTLSGTLQGRRVRATVPTA